MAKEGDGGGPGNACEVLVDSGGREASVVSEATLKLEGRKLILRQGVLWRKKGDGVLSFEAPLSHGISLV